MQKQTVINIFLGLLGLYAVSMSTYNYVNDYDESTVTVTNSTQKVRASALSNSPVESDKKSKFFPAVIDVDSPWVVVDPQVEMFYQAVSTTANSEVVSFLLNMKFELFINDTVVHFNRIRISYDFPSELLPIQENQFIDPRGSFTLDSAFQNHVEANFQYTHEYVNNVNETRLTLTSDRFQVRYTNTSVEISVSGMFTSLFS